MSAFDPGMSNDNAFMLAVRRIPAPFNQAKVCMTPDKGAAGQTRRSSYSDAEDHSAFHALIDVRIDLRHGPMGPAIESASALPIATAGS